MLGAYRPGKIDWLPRIIPLETGRKTMQMVMQSVRQDEVLHADARRLVRDLVDTKTYGTNLSSPDLRCLMKIDEFHTVRNYIASRLRYTDDPLGVELIYHPSFFHERFGPWSGFKRWGEDCDTFAGVTAAYLLSLGNETRLALLGFPVGFGFHHLVAEAFLENYGWITVDPSLSDEDLESMLDAVNRGNFYYPDGIEEFFEA